MKALIFSPYWDSLGGGERFVASVCAFLEQSGYGVEILSKDRNLLDKIDGRFDIKLKKSKVIDSKIELFGKKGKLLDKFVFFRKYDLAFFVSDGSVPLMFSRNNILLMQAPFKVRGKIPYLNNLKMKQVDHVVCYTNFTKKIIDKNYGVSSKVIYPPVKSIVGMKKKQKIILSVGRFDNLMHDKRQDVLVSTFKKLNLPDWKLILAGGSLGAGDNVTRLKKMAKGLPIEIRVNISHAELVDLYKTASIYWHAAGYGYDLNKAPYKAEHFGISTVEGMSAGEIPVVFDGGGLKEIVVDGDSGFLWSTIAELDEVTRKLIMKMNSDDKDEIDRMRQRAEERASYFSEGRFNESFKKIVG